MQKGVNRLFVAAGHKKKQISIKKKKKKQNARRDGFKNS